MRKSSGYGGFSLMEVAIVLFISGLILFMVSRLSSRTLTTLKFLQEKAQTLQSATLGIERLSSELSEATTVDGTDPLTFRKVDPSAPFALDYDNNSSPNANPGLPDPTIDPLTWSNTYSRDAFNRNQLGTLVYSVNNELLTRVASKDGRSSTSEVAANVNEFMVLQAPVLSGTNTGSSVFRITLAVLEQRRVVTFESIVVAPGLER